MACRKKASEKNVTVDIPPELKKRLDRECEKMGIRYWTEMEVLILKEYYPILGTKINKYLPNRTKGSIVKKAQEIGVEKK